MSTQDRAVVLTGGCLCAAIRYEVLFHKDTQWPPVSESCQCTMCRKWTGALIYQYLSVSPDQISPQFNSFPTYKEYPSSPGRYRGFCGQCGGSLVWRSGREGERQSYDLLLGSIDERWLVGTETDNGRTGGFGKLLCKPSGAQYWHSNAIEGVTDFLQGGRIYLGGKEG